MHEQYDIAIVHENNHASHKALTVAANNRACAQRSIVTIHENYHTTRNNEDTIMCSCILDHGLQIKWEALHMHEQYGIATVHDNNHASPRASTVSANNMCTAVFRHCSCSCLPSH